MKLQKNARISALGWMDFILNNADITDYLGYDIVDEYGGSAETMEMPVNYAIKKDEEMVYIIPADTKGLEQHGKHRQPQSLLLAS